MNNNDYVVVFGGCNMDLSYYELENGGYSSEPSLAYPGGKASNQAVALSRAGINVKLISRLGESLTNPISKQILDNLNKNGVDTSLIDCKENVKNDVSFIYVSKQGDNDIKRENGAIDSFTVDMVYNNEEIIKNSKFVVGQMKAPKEVSVALIEMCNKHNVPIIITPCRPKKLCVEDEGNLELINKITYITANQSECEILFNTKNIEECVSKFPNKLIVTLGEKGLMYHDGEKIVKIPAFYVNEVVDTTGAGDTLNGNLVAGLLYGMPLHVALLRAMASSTIKIQSKSAQLGMPTKDELDEFLRNNVMIDLHMHTTASDGIYSPNEIIRKILDFNDNKKKIIAFSDHDSVDAYFQIDKSILNDSLMIIPAVEFSFNFGGVSKDILGYGMDINKVKEYLDKRYSSEFLLAKQEKILQEFMTKADSFGVVYDKNLKCTSGKKSEAYGLMLKSIKAYPENLQKFPYFETGFYRSNFSNPRSNWYIDETEGLPSLQEIIDTIHKFGGLAFLAHPFDYKCEDDEKLSVINEAIKCGLDGIEVKHYSNKDDNVEVLRKIVKENNLYQSGGSDFHGQNVKKDVELFTGRNNNMIVDFVDLQDWLLINKNFNI